MFLVRQQFTLDFFFSRLHVSRHWLNFVLKELRLEGKGFFSYFINQIVTSMFLFCAIFFPLVSQQFQSNSIILYKNNLNFISEIRMVLCCQYLHNTTQTGHFCLFLVSFTVFSCCCCSVSCYKMLHVFIQCS